MTKQKESDSLPVFYRTAPMPKELWSTLKAKGIEQESSLNNMIHAAIDAELNELIKKLKEFGFAEVNSDSKLVRIPFDDNILGWINYGRRETGLPSILLLKLCLLQFIKNFK